MGYDAVLIDTAGRMQGNEPLMRALSKLVTLNSPDLVLFVGEALAGNEAVDQVSCTRMEYIYGIRTSHSLVDVAGEWLQ